MFEDTMSATEKSERNYVCTKNNKRGRNTTRRVRGERERARGANSTNENEKFEFK